jgi:hypothetical protein
MPESRTARLDALAKKEGYPSYAAMVAYKEKYQKPITRVVPGAGKPKERNFLQRMIGSIPNPMNYAAKTMRDATVRSRAKRKRK